MPGMRYLVLGLLVLTSACASRSREPAEPAALPESRGPRATAEAFVRAVNGLDTERAADLVAWEHFVAEDSRLQGLVEKLKHEYALLAPTPEARASHPFKNCELTLGQILDHPDPVRLLPAIAKSRFRTNLIEDFGKAEARPEARLLAWFQDSREASATILMPNGQPTEMRILAESGRYRLLPLSPL